MSNTAQPSAYHRRCGHTKYLMNCSQFDDLHARSNGQCEICGKPEQDNHAGLLHIDHDYSNGWAVRGLLCTSCNTHTVERKPEDPRVIRYLANPWFAQQVVIPAAPEPEGPVRDNRGRTWRKHHHFDWWGTPDSRTPRRTWANLLNDLGPHNFTAI